MASANGGVSGVLKLYLLGGCLCRHFHVSVTCTLLVDLEMFPKLMKRGKRGNTVRKSMECSRVTTVGL
jgi:hypothetical protein